MGVIFIYNELEIPLLILIFYLVDYMEILY